MTTHLPGTRQAEFDDTGTAVPARETTFDDRWIGAVAVTSMVLSAFVSGFLLTAIYIAIGSLVTLRWAFTPNRGVRLLPLVAPMLGIVLMGLIGSLGADHQANFIRRDIWTFGRALVVVWLGFLLALRMRPAQLLRITIVAGLIVSLWHLGRVVTNLSAFDSESANSFRGEVGRGFVQPALAVGVALNAYRWRAFEVLRLPLPIITAAFLLSLGSIVLSFSRTMFTIVIMVAILPLFVQLYQSATGGVRAGIRARRMFALILFATAVVALVMPLTSAGRDFGEKVGSSFDELAGNNFETRADITQSFRSYERTKALELFADGSWLERIVGFGYGQTVDLEVTLDFGGDLGEFRHVPVLHGGYTMTLVKTGVIGVVVFVFWHLQLWRVGRRLRSTESPVLQAFGEVQMYGIAAMMIVTPSVGGALNVRSLDCLLLLFGAGFAYLHLERKRERSEPLAR